jgi:hypothetical protein
LLKYRSLNAEFKTHIQQANSVIRSAFDLCICTTAGRVVHRPFGTCSGAGQESSVWTGVGGWNRV